MIEELNRADVYRDIGQAFAVLLPVQSVGVMGDCRYMHGAAQDSRGRLSVFSRVPLVLSVVVMFRDEWIRSVSAFFFLLCARWC